MKKLLLRILAFFASRVIRRHKPLIVGVTGTVGKSTTTHFIADFLSSRYPGQVLVSENNYNGEFGLPLTILRLPSGYSNPFLWLWILVQAVGRLFEKKYPRYVVLEYGVDRPGEMVFQCEVARPDIAVILNITPNHLINFESFAAYKQEKVTIAKYAKRLIINADDMIVNQAISDMGFATEIIRYSSKWLGVDIAASEALSTLEELSFVLKHAGQEYTCHFPIVGTYHVSNILPVFALGLLLGHDIITIRDSLAGIHPQKGRGSILHGVNDTIIIDGSYNWWVAATLSGIELVDSVSENLYKVVLLWDMRELGEETEKFHSAVADAIKSSSIDLAILVGPSMGQYVVPVLSDSWGSDRVFHFLNSRNAGEKMKQVLLWATKRPVVFVKGSQNTIYMEEAIKVFLNDSRDSIKLCRQSDRWMEKKEFFFQTVVPQDTSPVS